MKLMNKLWEWLFPDVILVKNSARWGIKYISDRAEEWAWGYWGKYKRQGFIEDFPNLPRTMKRDGLRVRVVQGGFV